MARPGWVQVEAAFVDFLLAILCKTRPLTRFQSGVSLNFILLLLFFFFFRRLRFVRRIRFVCFLEEGICSSWI